MATSHSQGSSGSKSKSRKGKGSKYDEESGPDPTMKNYKLKRGMQGGNLNKKNKTQSLQLWKARSRRS